MKSNNDIHALRREVKTMLAASDLDIRGNRGPLCSRLTERMGRNISISTLSMALNGYRVTEPYGQVLHALRELLDGEDIHHPNIRVNK